ncbi:MAG: TIGR02996 domain-containing protein [Planctomycetes bacterium]|nr:TIGR02996 domain-containing protein [Planctomycetota bacterium]
MTTERDALLAAICANPEDDTPRLVFADWLDEHNSPAWAELIRVECELARLADDGSAAEAIFRFLSGADQGAITTVEWPKVDLEIARRVELTLRATRLRGKAKSQMACVRPKQCGVKWTDSTDRGFPSRVTLEDPEHLIKALPALLKTNPRLSIIGLLNHRVGPELAVQLVEAGLLRWAKEVVLSHDTNVMSAFSSSSDAKDVRMLTQNGGGQEIVRRWLAVSANWNGLQDVALNDSEALDHDSAAEFLRAKHLHKLTRLIMHGRDWNQHTISELNNFTALRELSIRYCGLGDDAAIALANMPGLANLRSLSLHNNRITGRGATALLTSPHLANLGFLDLENNPVRGLDAKALAAAPPGGLRGVGFHACRLTIKDVAGLAAAPRLANLMYLDLDHNNLADSAVSGLVKGLGDRAPAILYLMGNRFGAKAAEVLAQWPAATGIQRLHLYGNPLDIAAARSLAGSPHFTNLKYISTSGVPIAGKNILKKRFGDRVRL